MAISATRVSRTPRNLPATATAPAALLSNEPSDNAAPAAPAPAAPAPKATKPATRKATKPATRKQPKAIILPNGKGSPERLAAGAKAAATRARNLAAMGIVPKAKQPAAPVNHQLSAYKAYVTIHRNMLPSTKGAVRKAILAKIAHYESLVSAGMAKPATRKATKATKGRKG